MNFDNMASNTTDMTVGNSSGSSTLTFYGDTQTTGTFIGNNDTWIGYPSWPYYPYPKPYRRREDYIQPFVAPFISEAKIRISLKEANDLKRAANKDPKLAKILKKFEGRIEIEADGLF